MHIICLLYSTTHQRVTSPGVKDTHELRLARVVTELVSQRKPLSHEMT